MPSTTPPAWLKSVETKNEVLHLRQKLFQTIRTFFSSRQFLEVETPILVPCPGLEPHLKVFRSEFQPEDPVFPTVEYFLATSPEYSMKKLLAAGTGNIFQICKCFRNGEFLGKHNPEFTMLEWYRVHATFSDLITDLEHMFQELAGTFGFSHDYTPPFRKLSILDLFQEHFEINLSKDIEAPDFQTLLEKKGMWFPKGDPQENPLCWNDLFTRAFIERIEPSLPKQEPFFLVEYPKPAAALAMVNTTKGKVYAERFEFYFGETELANGWTELRDPIEQAQRFEAELKERKVYHPGEKPLSIDQDFLDSLNFLPPCAGVAMGLDRLCMVLFKKSSIEDVLALPLKTFPPFR